MNSHDPLAQLADHIHQLTQPHTIPIAQHTRGQPTRWTAITHPPLLDQLRAAAQPGGGTTHGPERRTIPGSRPPIHLHAVDALTHIYLGLAAWHTRLNLPNPPRNTDWHHAALHQLVGAAATLAPSIADQLADDVHDWWRTAAVTAGWRPEHLLQTR